MNFIHELNGYLCALSDMNDCQWGTRYGFSAITVLLENSDTKTFIRHYLKNNETTIREIDLNEELNIIKRYVLNNYLLGTSDTISKEQAYVKNLHGWRIQEYISLASNYEAVEGRWVVEINEDKLKESYIFIQIKGELVVINLRIFSDDKCT